MDRFKRLLPYLFSFAAGLLGAGVVRVAFPVGPRVTVVDAPPVQGVGPHKFATVAPSPYRVPGLQLQLAAASICPSGTSCLFEDSATSTTQLHNPDNTITTLGPNWDKLFTPTAFSSGGAKLTLGPNINGGIEWLQINPHDNLVTPQTAPWTCNFATVSNGIGTKDDAFVGCGWNVSGTALADATQGHMTWNMENWCSAGTGCGSDQMEWYFTAAPGTKLIDAPDPLPAWQPNTLYHVFDVVTNVGQTYYCDSEGTSAAAGPGPTETNSWGFQDGTGALRWHNASGGFRWITANHRLTDGSLAVGIVGSSVCLGGGRTINDANQICAVGGPFGHSSVQAPAAADPAGTVIDASAGLIQMITGGVQRIFVTNDYTQIQQRIRPHLDGQLDIGGNYQGEQYRLRYKNVNWVGNAGGCSDISKRFICNEDVDGMTFTVCATAGSRSRTYHCLLSDAGIGNWVEIANGGA